MTAFATPADVLAFAIREEEGAAAFYQALAARATENRMRRIFESFAREEELHRGKLRNVRVEGPFHLPPELTVEMEQCEFVVPEVPQPDMDYADALRLAIRKEWAAFRLYSILAQNTDDTEVRKLLNGLAEEEARHHATFREELAQVEADGA